MLRIAIVEDDKNSQKQLNNYIEKFGAEQETTFEVTIFNDGIDIVEEYRSQFDIIFCDIQMKIMDGMETARKIRAKDKDVILIFITNMAEYAIQGYEVDAVGYLLKPVNYVSFSMYLNKASGILNSRKSEYLILNGNSGLQRIELANIYYISCEGHYLDIHTKSGVTRVLLPMKEMEKKLEGKSFSRCNSGYLVNLKYVMQVNKNEVTVGEDQLIVSRPRKKEFMQDLTNYLGGDN